MPARPPGAARTLLATAAVTLALAACSGEPEPDPQADSARAAAAAADSARADSLEKAALAQVDTVIAPALNVDLARMERRPSGLYVRERRRGTGAVADSGRWVTVDYTTWLADGTVLDDTREKGKPQNVLLGHGKVILAWEEGLRGMRERGRRLLVAPPALAYGKAGRPGSVPERATLVFDIEVKKVH